MSMKEPLTVACGFDLEHPSSNTKSSSRDSLFIVVFVVAAAVVIFLVKLNAYYYVPS